MSLFNELKRRKVFKVAAAYIIVAWLLLQVSDTLVPALHLPDWFHSGVAFVLILGFPVAIIFAWAFELTPDGLKREHEVDRSQSITHETSRKLDFIIIGVLVMALGYFAYDKLVLSAKRDAALVEATTQAVSEQAATEEASAESGKSIAVLPFINISSDPEQEYFSDGLAEELLNLLARIPEFQVTSRSSAFAFKGKEINIPEVAAALGVEHILEGSVRRSGNRIRVTAQLIDAKRDVHLWSETYERTFEDIFTIQDEISAAVVDALKVTLLGAAPKARKINPKALDLNLQASYFWRRRGPGDVELAREYFQLSLELEPNNAPAWAGLAVIYQQLGRDGEMPADESDRLFKEAALNAVSVDPQYPEGHIRLAWAYIREGNKKAAAKERTIAFQLNPENDLVVFDRAVDLRFQGKLLESIELFEKAAKLNPLSAIGQSNLIDFYTSAGRFDDAEIAAERARELSPDMFALRHNIVKLRILQGSLDEALELALALPEANNRQVFLAIIYFGLGDGEASDRAMQAIVDGGRLPAAAYRLKVHGFRGELDPAFEIMQMGIDNGIHFIEFLYDPFLISMHEDPRWEQLLRKARYDPKA